MPMGTGWVNADGVSGLNVQPGHATALRALAADGPLRQRMATAARVHCSALFTAGRFIADMRAAHAQMLRRCRMQKPATTAAYCHRSNIMADYINMTHTHPLGIPW